MLIEEAITARVLRDGGASKSVISTRLFPDYLPEHTTMPAVVYERKEGPPDYLIDGDIDIIRARWKFHCYASQGEKLIALQAAQAVFTDLHQYRMSFGDLVIHYTWYVGQADDYDGTTKRHRVTTEFEVWYTPH